MMISVPFYNIPTEHLVGWDCDWPRGHLKFRQRCAPTKRRRFLRRRQRQDVTLRDVVSPRPTETRRA